jgi:hypothetical protein
MLSTVFVISLLILKLAIISLFMDEETETSENYNILLNGGVRR